MKSHFLKELTIQSNFCMQMMAGLQEYLALQILIIGKRCSNNVGYIDNLHSTKVNCSHK